MNKNEKGKNGFGNERNGTGLNGLGMREMERD
jgi:hypothetical protein